MKNINRRNFLKSSLVTAASLNFTAKSWAQVSGANDTIRLAVIGFKGRGGDLLSGFRGLRNKGVEVVALCDVDDQVLRAGVDAFNKRDESVQGYRDLRRLFDNKNIDAVAIATPNHWHSLATIWAVQSGKDVYVEKPVSHNVWEGRKMVEAARKYRKIVQTGTQSRSSEAITEAVEWVQAGNLGKIRVARGLCYKPRGSIGNVDGEQSVPSHIDYDLWCGPAPKDPLRRSRLHYDWHWIWNYGNGDLGNQGIHQMDIARWFLGEQELSPRVLSTGGRLGYVDDGETPNSQIVFHDYKKAPLIFEVRGLPEGKGSKAMDKYKGGSVAVVIECEGGHVLVPNYTSVTAFDKEGKEIKKWSQASNHMENFINAVRSRKVSDLNADILEGHLSSALCHTGNISYRLGHKASPGEIREKVKAVRGGEESLNRMLEHLEANEVDLSKNQVVLGELLDMDPKSERFHNHTEANALLTRHYRRPFVVPENV